MVWPEANPDWKLVEGAPCSDLEQTIEEMFLFLDQLDFDSNGKPVLMEFDSEAQAAFDVWQTRLENRLRQADLPPHMEAHLAKYKKLVPALSLIFHYLHQSEDQCGLISKRELEYATVWVDYLKSHAEKVYHNGSNAVQKSAQNLIRRIKNGDVKEPFSARDVYQGHHWSGLILIEILKNTDVVA